MVFSIGSLQESILRRQFLACFHIVVHLVVKAAFQFGTHACQLLWVERDVLETCGIGAYADKVLHPGSAAEFSSARSCSAYAPGFLSRTNLFHLYTYMESICQHLDQLSEVYSFVGDVIEDSLVAVTLILHIANLHLQSQVFGYLSALYHSTVLTALCLLPFLEVHGLGYAVDTLDVVGRTKVGFLDLQFHQSSCQCHHANIVTRIGLYGYNVSLLQVQVVHVVVVTLACILELHFHKVCALCIARYVGKPVVCVQLAVLSTYCASAESSVATIEHSEFHILVIHDDLFIIMYIVYVCICW